MCFGFSKEPLNTHNICFGWEIIFSYALLSGGLWCIRFLVWLEFKLHPASGLKGLHPTHQKKEKPKQNNFIGSAVAQWKSAWLETEGPRAQASPASLPCGTWARHIYPSLELVQPRKICPWLTERLWMGCKESNQTNKTISYPFIFQGYKIFYTTDPSNPIVLWDIEDIVNDNRIATISGLIPNSTYTICVLAYSTTGQGPLSEPVQVMTRTGGRWFSGPFSTGSLHTSFGIELRFKGKRSPNNNESEKIVSD